MSENMVQRVAIAIATSHLNDPPDSVCVFDFYALTETVADQYYAMARAAIEAMREPTHGMMLTGLNCDAWVNAEGNAVQMLSGTFSAMIDAALQD